MIEIRTAQPHDKPQILALVSDAFGPQHAGRIGRTWDWQWQQDPRLSPPGYRGIVADWEGRLIATASLIPAGLFVQGQPRAAAWLTNVAVHEGLHRHALRKMGRDRTERRAKPTGSSRGLAARMFDHAARDQLLFGKRLSRPILVVARRNGFKDVPESNAWSRNLSFGQRLARLVGPWMASPLAILPNLCLRALPRPSAPLERLERDFDASFDELWDAARLSHGAIGRRDAQTLTWRYRRHPDTNYTALMIRYQGRLRGYVIVATRLKRRCLNGAIVDLMALPDDADAAFDLVAGAVRALKGLGADRVACFAAHPVLRGALERAGIRAESDPDAATVRGPVEPPIFITAGDGDGA